MLKIKNNINIKELEKFGFRPKYDEWDGELSEYFKTFVTGSGNFPFEKKHCILKIALIKDNWVVVDKPYSSRIYLDALYDLIKADLIEKEEGDYEYLNSWN